MDYFGDALSLVDKLGIKDIITFKTDFDPTQWLSFMSQSISHLMISAP